MSLWNPPTSVRHTNGIQEPYQAYSPTSLSLVQSGSRTTLHLTLYKIPWFQHELVILSLPQLAFVSVFWEVSSFCTTSTTATTPSRSMKVYTLGSMGDRLVTVKKCGGEYVVSIKRKDDETKCIELPPKRWTFTLLNLITLLFSTVNCVFVSKITRKGLDRFAWYFQGRCGATIGRPNYILDRFR